MATAGLCQTATNTYSSTVVVTIQNPSSGTITIADGAQTQTFSTTAGAQNTFTVIFPGLTSDGTTHAVTASLPGCSTANTTYSAPASCSVTPICNLSLTASGANCNPTTNLYVLSGVITLTNSPTSQTITLTDGSYIRSLTANAGTTTINYSYTTLQSDGAIHTVTLASSASACGTASTTYTAPTSCTVAPVCSVSAVATAGICASATNTYSATVAITLTNPTAGTLTVSNGVNSVTFAVPASVGTTTTSAIFNGLISDGVSHTVTVSLPGCSSTTATYTAPVSCTVAPALALVVTPGSCNSTTNQYTASGTISLTAAVAGTLTLTDGTSTTTVSVTPGQSSASFSLASLSSGTGSHTVTISGTNYPTTSATYTAPASCTIAPVCSVSLAVTPSVCNSATNQYSISGTLSLTNNSSGGIATITDGTQSMTVTVAASATSVSYSLTGLSSGSGSHTITASLSGCGTATVTYSAPTSCTVAPALALVVTPGVCNSATNQYTASGTISLTNAIAGTLTLTDGTSITTVSVTTNQSTASFSLTGLTSGTGYHTVTISGTNYPATSATYTAPTSCTVAPVCSVSAVVTVGVCTSATNAYSSTAVVTVHNPTSGTLIVVDGVQTLTFSTTANVQNTFVAVFVGLVSNGASHTVTASLPGCSTTTTTYTAPGSCTQPTGTQLALNKLVDKSKAKIGDVLTYTLVLTNIGTATATNVVVTDSMTTGLTYVANSATPPAGTTFIQGVPISTWTISSISIGQSLSMTMQVIADSSGVLYNKATIPGDTALVCTSVPVIVCTGDTYLFQLTAAPGRSSYRWFKDDVELTDQTTNVLNVTAPGAYSLAVDNVTGKCPDFSCCPFIVEEDTLPTFQARAVPVTCTGNTTLSNGHIVLTGFKAGYTYQYSVGSDFNPTASLSGLAKIIPANGVIVNTLANPTTAQSYTIRVYNAAGCYTDVTVLLTQTVCGCPTDVCIPFVITQTKRAPRIGDPR